MVLEISNRDARRLWIGAQGLTTPPTGPLDVAGMIKALGFVQLDTIRTVARAHHHILWSRNQNYREPMLWETLENRAVFEHFTHDASILPIEFYPVWGRQFRRLEAATRARKWYDNMGDCAQIKARIEREGPLSTHDFDTQIKGPRKMWSRPPHKLALDYMWYAGELSTAYRRNFTKFYDLSSRVVPKGYRDVGMDDAVQLDWLCREALARLSFGSLGDIQRFWGAAQAREVKAWATQMDMVPVRIKDAQGQWMSAVACADIKTRLEIVAPPTSRLRILNPFDPLIRDRARLERLFGFEYRIEIFVPAAKRRWGYYVYPLLEGDKFVGRIEVKGERAKGSLNVLQFWPEPGVSWSLARCQKLDAELTRMARFIGVKDVVWLCPKPDKQT